MKKPRYKTKIVQVNGHKWQLIRHGIWGGWSAVVQEDALIRRTPVGITFGKNTLSHVRKAMHSLR